MRGRLYKQYRPDFVLRNDLENPITAESPPVTDKIIRLLDKAKGGMDAHGSSLTAGNFIIDNSVMGYIRRSIEGGRGRVRLIPIVDKGGALAWPATFVKTDAEALDPNRDIHDPARRKISVESKRREFNVGGRRVYEIEVLLDPMSAGSAFLDRAVIDRLMAHTSEPKESKATFELWSEFNPSHRYAIGADAGKGNGGDHSTLVLLNFSTIPARLVGSYANNLIPADEFAYELKRQVSLFGTCLVAPEKNSESGGSCLTTLKLIYPADQIYCQVPLDRISDQPLGSGELGWETNGATKYTIL